MRIIYVVMMSCVAWCALALPITINITNENGHTLIQHTASTQIHSTVHNSVVSKLPSSNPFPFLKLSAWCAGALLSSYVGVVCYGGFVSAYLQRADRWACWKNDVPLAVLKELAATIIIDELRNDIVERYGAYDCGRCAHDSAQEQTFLEQFVRVRDYLEQWHIPLLFDLREITIKAQENIERLIFIRSLLDTMKCQAVSYHG